MKCGKLVVEVQKSPEETIPTEIFEHELRIMRGMFPSLRVVGRVLNPRTGKRVRIELGPPEAEMERLKARYANLLSPAGVGLSAFTVAYQNDAHRLGEAMREGVGDEELGGAGAPEEDAPEDPARVDYWTAEQWQSFLSQQAIRGWKRSWGAYRLRNLALVELELRGAKVGVTLDDMRCDEDAHAIAAEIEVAEEREAQKEDAQRKKAQAANA